MASRHPVAHPQWQPAFTAMNWDVVVVGAGPAGSSTAARLASAGLTVALLDRAVRPRPAVCGEFLSPGCRRLLAGLGVLQAVAARGRALHGMQIHTLDGGVLAARYPTGDTPGLSVRRAELDPILLATAIRRGARFLPGHQVSDLVWEHGAVAGVRVRCEGQETELKARLVVGADGRHSAVARRLGPVAPHRWLDKLAFVGYLENAERAEDRAEIFLGARRYGILNPVAPGLANLGIVMDRREYRPGQDLGRQLLEAAARVPGLARRLAGARLAAPPRCLGPLAHRARVLTAPGAALVGDAAGFLDPFTGEGIYAALRGAELLAGVAIPALDADGPPALGPYAAAWRHEFLPKWRLCMLFQHAIRRPRLAVWLAARLQCREGLRARLMAVVGDLAPPASLGPATLLLRMFRTAG